MTRPPRTRAWPGILFTCGRARARDAATTRRGSTSCVTWAAEVFGDFATWGTHLLEPPAGQPQLRRAVIGYDLDADLCDLDDAGTLLERGLRPSQVATRDRDVTQTWSRAIHDDGRYGGVSWWSYRDPRWTVAATWAHDAIRLAEVRQLDLDDEAFREAAEVLLRPVV